MAKQTQREPADAQVLEKGRVYFLYRPAVGEETPHGVVDLRRFYMVLHPDGGEGRRLIVVGHKKLPEADGAHQRYWGFVDVASSDPEALKAAMGDARPAGEGLYALARHGNHTHLSYVLDTPEKPGEVQEALNIVPRGDYVLSVKNPQASSPPGMGLDGDRKAELPDELQAKFGDRRFVSPDTPAFLDHDGTELLLLNAEDHAPDLGLDLEPDHQVGPVIFADLDLERTERTTEPLMKGHWF